MLVLAPAIARNDRRTCGVFSDLDFHISPERPKLIEINSNAGGPFVNIAAHDAQIACCLDARRIHRCTAGAAQLEAELVTMFQREWMLARGDAPLRSIAIVDVQPRGQFLYPEFLLAQQLLESQGIRPFIADFTSVLDMFEYRVVFSTASRST